MEKKTSPWLSSSQYCNPYWMYWLWIQKQNSLCKCWESIQDGALSLVSIGWKTNSKLKKRIIKNKNIGNTQLVNQQLWGEQDWCFQTNSFTSWCCLTCCEFPSLSVFMTFLLDWDKLIMGQVRSYTIKGKGR